MRRRGQPAVAPLPRWKLWFFRALAALGVPLLLAVLLELGLRGASYGCRTAFLLPTLQQGRPVFVENPKFGRRFFGPKMARVPIPCVISATKTPGTVRIFVFGESAAMGDPQPQFGLPRMLEALLSLRYPGVRFEVVNASMTAIDSHVILPIARDCAAADGDLWVLYVGNNEAVGPFGAGTVFGPQAPSLPLIRASVAFKTTRLGQGLDSLRQYLQPAHADQGEWGGMSMFLGQQLRADAAKLHTLYHHFERNLGDILEVGHRAGVGIVVTTVAVNLKDCAPFGSSHRPDWSAPQQAQWEQWYQSGLAAQTAGRVQDALAHFEQAAQSDDTFADLRFQQAQCLLALGSTNQAQREFQAARDLDTLRFRCDSRLNELTRRLASGRAQQRILLADAENVFAAASPAGLPGNELFYEHVHLTFEGNYLLARTVAAQLERLLPAPVAARVALDTPWPSVDECARRLAWSDWSRAAAWSEIFTRLNRPPFTAQLNHQVQLQQVAALLRELTPASAPEGMRRARALTESALAVTPADPWLLHQLAALQQAGGDLAGAAASERRATELLPGLGQAWYQLGLVEAQLGHFLDAADSFRRAVALDPQEVGALQNLGHALLKLGRSEEAIHEYRRAVALKPRFGPAWLALGSALEQGGKPAEAEECYRQALAHPVPRAAELAAVARFCEGKHWAEAAATNYLAALELSPNDSSLRLEAGRALAALGRHAEAARLYAEAVRLAPDSGLAHFLYGLELGRGSNATQAEQEFRTAVRLRPDLLEARLDLAFALMSQDRLAEALAEYEAVLQRSPTNATALKAAQTLRTKLSAAGSH